MEMTSVATRKRTHERQEEDNVKDKKKKKTKQCRLLRELEHSDAGRPRGGRHGKPPSTVEARMRIPMGTPRHLLVGKWFSVYELDVLTGGLSRAIRIPGWNGRKKEHDKDRWVALQIVPLLCVKGQILPYYPASEKERRRLLTLYTDRASECYEVLVYDRSERKIAGTYKVQREELTEPCIDTTTYIESCDTALKRQINSSFARLVKEQQDPRGNIIVLDSSALQTSRALHEEAKIPWECIHVPNPSAYMWRERTDAPVCLHQETVALHLMRLPAATCEDERFSFALDYCGTFEGNYSARACPRHDLDLLFAKQLLRKQGGVLWLTLSTRGKGKRTSRTELETYVLDLAARTGYTSLSVHSGQSYGKHMYYVFFVTK